MILALRTDKPEAELYLYKNNKLADSFKWTAHRELADTLLTQIQNLLKKNNMELNKLTGVIVFTGEGSFTGLRIGSTVANTMAYSYDIPIVSAEGKNWLNDGLKKLPAAKPGGYVVPKYHSEPNITTSKKLSLEDTSK
jgi:tRNA threonylcarbamoyl adenosine modification protein YeaZ